jgi:ABC-type uncharacterized transport system substrate-binding protein
MAWLSRRLHRPAWVRAASAVTAMSVAASGVLAHPHVWVSTKSEVIFENGALAGVRLTWLFDEMYTMAALEGLDTNKDGKVEGPELDELTKVNIEGLKEFGYFTSITMAGEAVPLADPRDYSMEVVELDEAPGPQMVPGAGLPAEPLTPDRRQMPVQDQQPQGLWARFTGWLTGLFGRTPAPAQPPTGIASSQPERSKVLALHMTLPLETPLPAARLDSETKGFQFLTSDSQMYIWFEPRPKDGVGLAPGAPEGCRTAIVEPEMSEEQKRLAEAFGRIGSGGGAASIFGSAGKAVAVVCTKP